MRMSFARNRTWRPRDPRVVVDRPARAAGRQVVTGRVRDLSARGAFVACERAFGIGERLLLRFTVEVDAGEAVVEAQGEVAHRRAIGERGIGVRFVRLSREGAVALQSFLEARGAFAASP
jgi:hypothetical protein